MDRIPDEGEEVKAGAEKPILFSAPMVRAILAGRKTMTRRVVKPQPALIEGAKPPYSQFIENGLWYPTTPTGKIGLLPPIKCPYGTIGTRLWVRETWTLNPENSEFDKEAIYRADSDWDDIFTGLKWKPSIYMPRWASRITLEITGVRVERVQDIKEADANAEAASCTLWYQPYGKGEMYQENLSWSAINPVHPSHCKPNGISYRNGFATLWDSINEERGFGWHTNPYVWVLQFERVAP